MWEREFALACVKRVVADSRRATAPGLAPASGPLAGIRRWWSRRHAGKADGVQAFANVTDKDIEKTFGRIYSEMLSRRANPVVRSRVVVPVLAVAPQPSSAGGDRLAGASPKPRRQVTVPRVLHFEQRPAIAVSDALAASLAADGVQGAHCHERTQHKHAVNLFVSRMDDDRGHRMLTITRHGVLAANQLERKGIRSLRDEDLYRIAVDLADTLASTPIRDTRLRDALKNNEFDDLQSKDHAGQPSKAKVAAIAALIRGQRPRTKTSAIAESEGLRSASVIEDDRRVADGRAPAMPTLIDNIRRAASLNRAREAAAAAFASLPDDEIRRLIHATAVPEGKYDDPDPTRRVPATLRLCSVSLMTPDWFRATFYSYEDDERTMWQDQARAWADLESLGGLALPMPRVDAEGLPLRDSNGCLLTVAPSGPDGGPAPTLPIRFQVAALNTPVNAWGTRGRRAGAISGAHAAADDINRHAITRLIGNTPEAWASCPPGQIPKGTGGSWLSNHLRSTTVSDKEKRILRTLAAQIGALYASKAHLSAGNDPYKLATRLIVLANRLGGTAAASPIATLVNCKSGKDRTSVAETEARQMALEIDVTGEVPPVGAEVTELLTRQLGAIHESGGSRPLQAWNTGMAGTKLEGEALYRRFGLFTKDRIRSFLGLSKFTKG